MGDGSGEVPRLLLAGAYPCADHVNLTVTASSVRPSGLELYGYVYSHPRRRAIFIIPHVAQSSCHGTARCVPGRAFGIANLLAGKRRADAHLGPSPEGVESVCEALSDLRAADACEMVWPSRRVLARLAALGVRQMGGACASKRGQHALNSL